MAGLTGNPYIEFLLLIVAIVGISCIFGSFRTLPTFFLTESSVAAGIALINSVGNIGGFNGPTLVGILAGMSGNTDARLIAVGACLAVSGILAIGFPLVKQ